MSDPVSVTTVLYYIHVGCVVTTGTGFVFRWGLSLRKSPLLQSPVVRILPHFVDSALLFSGLGMSWLYGLNPFVTPWLLAKLIALLGYILSGHLALKLRYPFRLRLISGVLALTLLGYIIAVAMNKDIMPWRG
jgi:uncharacterized membrane protein SirB2